MPIMEKNFIESKCLSNFTWYRITIFINVIKIEDKPYAWIVAKRGKEAINETWQFSDFTTAGVKYKELVKEYIK